MSIAVNLLFERPAKRWTGWTRSRNLEGTAPVGLAVNEGGNLWNMDTRSERRGSRFMNRAGGIIEIYEAYECATYAIEKSDRRPLFESDNSTLFAAGIFAIRFLDNLYKVKLRDSRTGEKRELEWTKTK